MKIGIQTHGENGSHIYTTDSPEMEHMGLSSYSYFQASGMLIDSIGGKNITGGIESFFEQITQGSSCSECTARYMKFNKSTGGYAEEGLAGSEVKSLIEWHERFTGSSRYAQNPSNDYTSTEASGVLASISNGLSGCITFLASGLSVDYTAPENDAGCEKDFVAKINLYFTNRSDEDQNQIIQKFEAMAGIPSTAAGTPYSWQGTNKAITENHPGVLSPVKPGAEKNTSNMVAAPIAKSYCANTGRWEFGTQQVLVRLLTNVEGVSETEVDSETFDNLSYEELSNPGSVFYLSNFTTGWASPIYPQNKNPSLAMPAFVTKACDTRNTKEKIIVVNRSTRDYALGELAMACKICGEWILTPLGDPKPVVFNPVINKWRFQKFIVDADSYFKNWKYWNSLDYDGELKVYTLPPPLLPRDEREFSDNVSPQDYETSITRMYFIDMSAIPDALNNDYSKIAKANLNASKSVETLRNWSNTQWGEFTIPTKADEINEGNIIVPSNRYWQSTSADQMGYHTGGWNNKNIIGHTNISFPPPSKDGDDDDETLWAYKFNHFWGPIFNDGYDAGKISNINDNQVSFKSARLLNRAIDTSYFYPYAGDIAINDDTANYNMQHDEDRFMFKDTSPSWPQFPAEMALLGGMNAKNGGPQECFDIIKSGIGPSLINNSCYVAIGNVMEEDASGIPKRWDWLYIDDEQEDDYLVNDLYDLKPNSNSITFMPLCAESVGSPDKFSGSIGQVKLGSRGDLDPSIFILRRLYMTARGFDGNLDLMAGSIFAPGKVYKSRYPFLEESTWITGTSEGVPDSSLTHTWGGSFFTREEIPRDMKSFNGGEVTRSYDVIPYDYAVRQTANHSNGGPSIWSASNFNDDDYSSIDKGISDDADCVGVVCAKVSMSWNQETIPIQIAERFGLTGKGVTFNVGANETNLAVGFLGIPVFNVGPTAGQATRVDTPQWGSTKDSSSQGGLYSFCTNALYARVFSQWPEKQTLFDGRYFGVLHFNPGHINQTVEADLVSDGVTFDGVWNPAISRTSPYRTANLPDYQRYVDKITEAVDFRVPTYADPRPSSGEEGAAPRLDNEVVPTGTQINRCGAGTTVLRPEDEWRVNPIRRGQLFAIAANGQRVFRYFKRVIGVTDDTDNWKYNYQVDEDGELAVDEDGDPIDDGRGEDYSVNDEVGLSGGSGFSAKIKITSVNDDGGVTGFEVLDKGEGYLPSNFKSTSWGSAEDRLEDPLTLVASVNIKTKKPTAKGLKLGPLVGVVYDRLEEDLGPKESSSLTRLSTASAGGERGIITSQKTTSISLTNPSANNRYDVFFHFHNDIQHTLAAWREWNSSQQNGLQQFCSISIG